MKKSMLMIMMLMMNDEWWMMNDGWWMMDDGWWMMDDEGNSCEFMNLYIILSKGMHSKVFYNVFWKAYCFQDYKVNDDRLYKRNTWFYHSRVLTHLMDCINIVMSRIFLWWWCPITGQMILIAYKKKIVTKKIYNIMKQIFINPILCRLDWHY
jgi:hypothetical protein